MKLKLQGPSLAQVPSKALGGTLVRCSHGPIWQRYFNHNRPCVIEVCQAVNRDVVLFFLILWFCVCVCGGGGICQLFEMCNLL